jgi:hypothetical protein
MSSDDLARHLADAPRVVRERPTEDPDVIAWASPQQSPDRPDSNPVGLRGRYPVGDQAACGRTTEGHDELGIVSLAGEQTETSADKL